MKERLLLFCVLVVLLVSGCHSDGAGEIVKYDIAGPVENLDPQFATDVTARMIIANLFEGLLVLSPEGELRPGVAEHHTVSDDGLRYTFTLRANTSWWDSGTDNHGQAVTSQDFAFALQRLLSPEAPSPYAEDFLSIRNAQAVLDGRLPPSELGIATPDPQTLVISLEKPDPLFLENLASTAAMPCNRVFFDQTRGKYGLSLDHLRTNGPFRLSRWDNSKYLLLVKNENYTGALPTAAAGVNLYIGRGDAAERFLTGATDVARLSGAQSRTLSEQHTVLPIEKTVWCIVFNQNTPVLGNPLIRQGLVSAVDRTQLSGHLSTGLRPTGMLVPSAMHLSGHNYRAMAGNTPPLSFDPERARQLFELGLSALHIQALPTLTLHVPETGDHALYAGLVQQSWQQHLSAFVNIQRTTAADIEQRLQNGDYQMLLMPFTPAGPRIDSLLAAFSSRSSQNHFGYYSSVYDATLQNAAKAESLEDMAGMYARAELLLLSDAVVLPLYSEDTYYALGHGVAGIEIFPFGGQIYFKYAKKPG